MQHIHSLDGKVPKMNSIWLYFYPLRDNLRPALSSALYSLLLAATVCLCFLYCLVLPDGINMNGYAHLVTELPLDTQTSAVVHCEILNSRDLRLIQE